jgi:hypothetical protein
VQFLVWALTRSVFLFQHPVKLDDKCHHFGGVFFITDFLGNAPPISGLWGHWETALLNSLKATLDGSGGLSNIALQCTSQLSHRRASFSAREIA